MQSIAVNEDCLICNLTASTIRGRLHKDVYGQDIYVNDRIYEYKVYYTLEKRKDFLVFSECNDVKYCIHVCNYYCCCECLECLY